MGSSFAVKKNNHPILFIPKNEGTLYIYIDYRLLNENTITDHYSLPRIDNILGCLCEIVLFIKIYF